MHKNHTPPQKKEPSKHQVDVEGRKKKRPENCDELREDSTE